MLAGGNVVRWLVACAAAALAFAGAGRATASQTLGDREGSNTPGAGKAKGEALLTSNRLSGKLKHVLVWGAINALPPSQDVPQVRFKMDYSRGRAQYHSPGCSRKLRS